MAVWMKSCVCKFYSSFNKGGVQLMQFFCKVFPTYSFELYLPPRIVAYVEVGYFGE